MPVLYAKSRQQKGGGLSSFGGSEREHGARSGKALHIIKGHEEDEARIICHAYERSQDSLGGMHPLFLLFCPDNWPVLMRIQVVLFLM